MFREQIIKILIHPFFIGLVITVVVMGFVMPDFSRYRVREVEKVTTGENKEIFFSDLDHDGTSEEIIVDNIRNLLKIMLLRGSKVIEQYNLRSNPLSNDYFYSGDYNSDGYEEIYLFTLRNDSILLSIIEPLILEDFIVKERLVFHSDSIHYKTEIPEANISGLVAFSGGLNKKLVFSICTGFSKQPRNVFRYDITNDRLEISPLSGVSIRDPFLFDLDTDSVPEILMGTAATGNYSSYVPYSDHSSWLMVLDGDMDFLFPPVEFTGYPSSLQVAPFSMGDSVYIAVLHYYYGTDTIQPGLYVYDNKGRIVRSREFEVHGRGRCYLATGERDHHTIIYLLDHAIQVLREYDANLNLVRTREIPSLHGGRFHSKTDLDNDGSQEMIFKGKKTGSFFILREGFVHPLVVDFEETNHPSYFCTLTRDGRDLFYTQYKNVGYIAAYEKNPFFLMKYPLGVAVYVLISLAVLLIFRLQKYRAQRQYVTQKKINELQILSLKNQIDPHFTFNILNAIGSLYIKGSDRNRAYTIFIKYSDLLRQTIRNSDKISVSLEEEIKFIENYIELEQIRSDYSFQCSINIDDHVDLGKKIPRMLIYSFVENSIKHGIRRVQKEGNLEITISRSYHHHQISIKDNGPGLNNNAETRIGTGKGMQIIDELIALFFKLEGNKISYTLRDLSSGGQDSRGTEVLITLPD